MGIILIGIREYAREMILNNGLELSCFVGFYDYFEKEKTFEKLIPRLSIDEVKSLSESNTVILAESDEKIRTFYADELNRNGIIFSLYKHTTELPPGVIRISGIYPDIKYECNIHFVNPDRTFYFRTKHVMKILQTTFAEYHDVLTGKNLDFCVCVWDEPDAAYNFVETSCGRTTIFTYCTTFAHSYRCIPFPDYRTYYDAEKYDYVETPELCKEAANALIIDDRAFFSGNIASNPVRHELYALSKKCNRIKVNSRDAYSPRVWNNGDNNYIPMLEQTKYKYLIDVPGTTWSDRTKIYMQLGRPILFVERNYIEWWMQYWRPYKHFVPVKHDLSDLEERIKELDNDEALYKSIVENMKAFSEKFFSRKYILGYVKDIILKFGYVSDC